MARCTDAGRHELCLDSRTYGFPLAICCQEHLILGDILRLPLRHRLIRNGFQRGLNGLKFRPQGIDVLRPGHHLKFQFLASRFYIGVNGLPVVF